MSRLITDPKVPTNSVWMRLASSTDRESAYRASRASAGRSRQRQSKWAGSMRFGAPKGAGKSAAPCHSQQPEEGDAGSSGVDRSLVNVRSFAAPLTHPSVLCHLTFGMALPAASLRLLYSPFAEAFLAYSRIDFAARLRWLPDLRKPNAVAGRANNFGQNFTWFFHNDQSSK